MDHVSDGDRRRRWRLIGALVIVGAAVVGAEQSHAATGSAVASVVVPVTPFRILDTRQGIGTGGVVAPVGADSTITLQVAGVGTVPADATGIVLNVTASGGTEPGYVTVYPAGQARPEASVLNITPGQDLPNMITASLGDGGRLDLYNFSGSVHLIADVAAYLVATGTDGGAPGPQGPQGPQGAQGPAGPRGFSAWDAIPSGVTVTGSFVYDSPGPVQSTDEATITIDLPGVAVPALTMNTVEFGAFGPSTDESPLCDGDNFDATAPAGMVCIYIAGYGSGLTDIAGFAAPLTDRGFNIRLTGTVNQVLEVSGVWAYTAP